MVGADAGQIQAGAALIKAYKARDSWRTFRVDTLAFTEPYIPDRRRTFSPPPHVHNKMSKPILRVWLNQHPAPSIGKRKQLDDLPDFISNRTSPQKKQKRDPDLATQLPTVKVIPASPFARIGDTATISSETSSDISLLLSQDMLKVCVPYPHTIKTSKVYKHGSYKEPAAPVKHRLVPDCDLLLNQDFQGFWVIPVSPRAAADIKSVSEPTWDVNASALPNVILWNPTRLSFFWESLANFAKRYGGIFAYCCFQRDKSMLKYGDHIRIHCSGDLALCLRGFFRYFTLSAKAGSSDSTRWLKHSNLVFYDILGRPLLVA